MNLDNARKLFTCALRDVIGTTNAVHQKALRPNLATSAETLDSERIFRDARYMSPTRPELRTISIETLEGGGATGERDGGRMGTVGRGCAFLEYAWYCDVIAEIMSKHKLPYCILRALPSIRAVSLQVYKRSQNTSTLCYIFSVYIYYKVLLL